MHERHSTRKQYHLYVATMSIAEKFAQASLYEQKTVMTRSDGMVTTVRMSSQVSVTISASAISIDTG